MHDDYEYETINSMQPSEVVCAVIASALLSGFVYMIFSGFVYMIFC